MVGWWERWTIKPEFNKCFSSLLFPLEWNVFINIRNVWLFLKFFSLIYISWNYTEGNCPKKLPSQKNPFQFPCRHLVDNLILFEINRCLALAKICVKYWCWFSIFQNVRYFTRSGGFGQQKMHATKSKHLNMIFVTGTTGSARGEKICHVEKFLTESWMHL